MSTSERLDENATNHGTRRYAAERLHQWLHLIAESDERSAASVLVDVVIETLGGDAVERIAEAIQRRAGALKN